MTDHERARSLSDAQIAQFIEHGFVRIDDAFPCELAEEARAILWRDLPCREHDPGDAGWHVDLSFPGEDCDPDEQQDFSAWRVNVISRGRALLMLFLFSDVGTQDAPTRIRVGSHMDMARFLEPAGEAGMSHMMLD